MQNLTIFCISVWQADQHQSDASFMDNEMKTFTCNALMTMEMLRHSSRRTSAIFEKLRLVLAVVGLQLSKYFCMPSTKSAVPMQLPSRLFCRLLTCNVRQGRIQKFQLRFWSNNPPPFFSFLLFSFFSLPFPSFSLPFSFSLLYPPTL